MDLRKLKTLIELVESSGIAELEIQEGEERVRITRTMASGTAAPGAALPPVVVGAAPQAPVAPAAPAAEAPPPAQDGHVVKSPMVGTFYRSATPGAKAFVEVGDTVEEGQTLCIVEAMKLFNELEAEFPCVIEEALLDNAQPVEFGTRLFKVRKL